MGLSMLMLLDTKLSHESVVVVVVDLKVEEKNIRTGYNT